MDFNITAGEEAVVCHVASRVQDGFSLTDDDLAEELGEGVEARAGIRRHHPGPRERAALRGGPRARS
ncbi:hypothetical protein ACIG53_14845 [Streptomyces bauhiniae]|uniref:hypothetical protein n=1 Tax=Streptomyces bauhiniae TaxID=2340725 RepID=UPI0037D29FE2